MAVCRDPGDAVSISQHGSGDQAVSRNAASKIRLVDLASGFDFDGIWRTIGCEWCYGGMEKCQLYDWRYQLCRVSWPFSIQDRSLCG